METIPVWFWMVVISSITVLFCLILYYVAMLIRESTSTMVQVRETISDARKTIGLANKMVEDASVIVESFKGTAVQFNQSVVDPIKGLGGILSTVTGFLGRIFG